MKERPILFSGGMVRAILDGCKTQTRRVIKPQPQLRNGLWLFEWGAATSVETMPIVTAHATEAACPYGKPGDRLWVRESFYECVNNNDRIRYAADGPAPTTPDRKYKKRPSIFLPRLDSRITLEVVNVRVERVQEISEEDARLEGVDLNDWYTTKEPQWTPYRYAFAQLWNRINGPDSWNANPWVWAVTFNPLSPTESSPPPNG